MVEKLIIRSFESSVGATLWSYSKSQDELIGKKSINFQLLFLFSPKKKPYVGWIL